MGGVLGRGSRRRGENCRVLKQKVKLLEEEIVGVRCKSEQENRVYEQQAVAFMAKEAQWKHEKKKWKEEVGRLRRRVEEKEEKIRRLEEKITATTVEGKSHKELQNLSANLLVEQMIEEQALREEAVEKWKRLYLAIKTELDDLILRTRQGERLWRGAEEDRIISDLQGHLKAKEEIAEGLREKVSALEKEAARREREVDILRQSLRIMSNSKQARGNKNLRRSFFF
ncbi:hypothetical protein H6P81_012930 [Aristolochia fimbriata]|uniref:Uncharacterized protein n=1 Tax=Aristolochia fimbriata TaxID=158543 RepID=A0AAV7EGU7_ARIFI|nr:hypothetical protein H6P81_012930 [Aristolochia fimbriata]